MNPKKPFYKKPVFYVIAAIVILAVIVVVLALNHDRKMDPDPTPDTPPQTEGGAALPMGEVELIDYKFDDFTMKPRNNASVTLPVEGQLALPAGTERVPVVFVLHPAPRGGEGETANGYYGGYENLLNSLAERGIAAVSINIAPQYATAFGEYDRQNAILMEHINRLMRAVTGEETNFPKDITGRLDFENLGLIGHGEAATGLFSAAEMTLSNVGVKLRGLLLVSPNTTFTAETRKLDVPTAILEAATPMSGANYDGMDIFEELAGDNLRDGFAVLTTLEEGSAYDFNSRLGSDGSDRYQSFLGDYAADFFNTIFTRVNTFVPIGMSVREPDELYGMPARSLVVSPKRKLILHPTGLDDEKMSKVHGDIMKNLATLQVVTDSEDASRDTAGSFVGPGSGERMYYRIRWEQKGATVVVILPPGEQDLTGYESLSLMLAVDPTDSLNKAQEQSFSVALTDVEKTRSSVTLSGRAALRMTAADGQPSALGEIRIPLDEFDEAHLKQIGAIELSFDQTDSGSILLWDLSLQKEIE
ncbi:hypothetical protein [Feifania hominis]|uniref:Alpha/beta hydrolase n=1 Tax=Feifania hominis TaxID=2763660 RepID=A0A926DC73_9FIRM|nr:hypothetical protein [Feifania hominis]MBC8535883.1 hypothetical protein [Feifania hominis]